MEIFHPTPHCTCTVSREGDALCNSTKFNVEELIHLFLTGVNDHYAIIMFPRP